MDNERNMSLEEITRIGERFYLDTLKADLEKSSFGQYAVIDVEQKKYAVDPDRLVAVEKARKEFGENKLFYIVQIGMLQQPTMNYMAKKHAWLF